METHSSILAWRITGMEEPGGLPSMGSHRVGHNWSDLAAAAACMCVCMCMCVCVNMCVHAPMCVCAYVCECACVCVCERERSLVSVAASRIPMESPKCRKILEITARGETSESRSSLSQSHAQALWALRWDLGQKSGQGWLSDSDIYICCLALSSSGIQFFSVSFYLMFLPSTWI